MTVFQTQADAAGESATARALGNAWKAEVVPMPDKSPIDWFIMRDNRIVAIAELKIRKQFYSTMWLSFRKYFALTFGSMAFGVPGLIVYRCGNTIKWCDVAHIAHCQLELGQRREHRARNDTEPVLHVPTDLMKTLELRDE